MLEKDNELHTLFLVLDIYCNNVQYHNNCNCHINSRAVLCKNRYKLSSNRLLGFCINFTKKGTHQYFKVSLYLRKRNRCITFQNKYGYKWRSRNLGSWQVLGAHAYRKLLRGLRKTLFTCNTITHIPQSICKF